MRLTILALGLAVVIVMIMPQAVAKFTGQHQFVNGSSVNCGKCHPDIVSEYNSDINQPHRSINLACIDCHIGTTDPFLGRVKWSEVYTLTGEEYYKGIQFHGAALVECLWCHTNNTYITAGADINAEFNSSKIEAHRPLYYRTKNASGVDTSDLLQGANEACVSCHTHAANVTIIEPSQHLNITASSTNCTGWYPGFTGNSDANCYNDGYSFNWSISFSINTL